MKVDRDPQTPDWEAIALHHGQEAAEILRRGGGPDEIVSYFRSMARVLRQEADKLEQAAHAFAPPSSEGRA